MNSNTYNLGEDWGWYFDTENDCYINNSTTTQVYNIKKIDKKINYYINKMDPIEEQDEYYDEELDPEYYCIKINKNTDKKNDISLYKISSTTIITLLLTYTIFFVI